MPVPGRKPKPDGAKRNRAKPTFEWVDVGEEPYVGPRPALPKKRRVLLQFGATKDVALHPLTKQWWEQVSRMPHCRLWAASDWQYAVTTALVADAFFYGHSPSATELARREKVMGTSLDARRDLRIRYVAPQIDEEAAPAGVTAIADYRAMVAGDG